MKKKVVVIILAAMMAMTAVGCTSNSAQNSSEDAQESASVSAGLTVKPLTAKVIDANPYMGKGDSNIHHDCYNTDSTDEILPLAIYPEINVS